MRTLLTAFIGLALCSPAAAENSGPLPTFAETCFQARPAGSFLLVPEAQRMLEGAGPGSHLSPGDRGSVRLNGLFRVRDWTPESTLLVALDNAGSQLRIHAWGEGRGVSLFLTPAGAAYRITQQPGEGAWKQDFRTCLTSLLATDDRRGFRLPHGAYQVHCQDGAVVVTKGNVRLLTAPLEGAVKSLYIEVPDYAVLQDLALFRSGPVPEELSPVHRVVLDGKQPARLAWKGALPKGARLQKLGDGCVELAVENTAETASANVSMARPGLFEVVAQIDDATPGTGIALLNAKGEPLDGIEFGREGKTQIAFGFGSQQQPPSLGNYDYVNRPAPLIGPRHWLRLVMAAGSIKCWVSGDGVHWGRALEGHDRYGPWQSIALYARAANDRTNPDNAARHIRLRSLHVRDLSGLTGAVAADLLVKAATAGVAMKSDQGESPQAWTERITRLASAGSSPTAWRYACALQALAALVQPDAAQALLHRAVREHLNDLRSTRAKIDLLQDAALVWPCRLDRCQTQLEHWDRLGREVLNAGVRAEFALYQQALMQTSLSDPPEHSGPISWELARDATILFSAERREADLIRITNLVLFWRGNDQQVGGWPAGPQLDLLLKWLNVHAMSGKPQGRATAINSIRAVTPLLSRAGNNILSELQSTLEGRQYADAARILVTCAPPRDEGLVPVPNDDRLFVSFPTVVRLLMLEHRGLAEAMVGQVGPADQFKIEQTLAQGDVAAVDALSLQYCGAPAAALPCQWLGDRALAAADLAQAILWYDEGLRWAAPAQQPELAARKRLVSAMLGLAWGQPATQPVAFAGAKAPPQQFEGWVRDQLARRRTAAEAAASADFLPAVAAVQPGQFQAAIFDPLNASAGQGIQGAELPYELGVVDWTWRHATVLGEDSALAVERSRIVAFDLVGGRVRWESPLRNGPSPNPSWPLVRGQRIYVRTAVAGDRAGVACLDGKTGRNLWLRDCGGTAACDPLWYRGRLFVLTIGPAGEQVVAPLCLVELHPETGEVISRRQILEINEREKLPSECQASWAGNRLVALVAGCVLSIDMQGRIAWLRQETTLPSAIDPAFAQQRCQPAIESGGWLFVQQPGSCAIDCLAQETGRLRWRRGIIGLQSIADLSGNRLLARTARGLVAMSKTTGEVLWQCESPSMLSAFAHTTSGLILGAAPATIGGKPQLVFLGIDPALGQARARGAVPLEKNQPILFGPVTQRSAGPGDKAYEAVLVSPTAATLGLEEIRVLAQRLRQEPGQIVATFDADHRIEGSLASGWRGSGATIAHDGPAQAGLRSLRPDGLAPDAAPQSDALLEFHNGDRLRGTIRGYVAASTQPGQSAGAQVLVQLAGESQSAEKPIAVETDWLRRIVFDAAGQSRHCPPRSLVCRDGRVMAFRTLRFSGDGVILLTDHGLLRLAYHDLTEIMMQPVDAWEAYQRQLAKIDPNCDAGIVRLVAGQSMILTVSASAVPAAEVAGSTCYVQPAWSRTPVPVAWSNVCTVWRAPATVVPLSLFAPQQVAERGALGSSWKWQADRNVAGGELCNGGVRCLWGFGVHAPNEMVFRLPDSARTFHSGLGIDAAVGDSGCVVAKVYLNAASGTPVYQSKPLLGGQPAVSTGEINLVSGNAAARQLVLVVEDGGAARGPNADPLDIGNHVDWLEPTLLLDADKLRAAVKKYRPAAK